ncbi:penicillin-binding protein 1C [Lyngbya confervoides]|uniref:Penicillin-binding protein 1C n=1 Tax=Lyngbya confervoides BDU141951 TaxID=1574623 RepID=A0ABD4T4R3_9CYAN|nr:penicillin-binding protein 1C [Lyngbya confervoides]MCM1983509.1 penicillin-binding protein 1C [Lyngbya confervoides BDU141951]
MKRCFENKKKWGKGLLAATFTVLGLRLLPYLAPVKAQDLIQNDRAIEFRDRHGLPLGTLLSRNQDHTAVVPLDQIAPEFLQAIIAAEDGRFYQHGPLDWIALGRAGLEALDARQMVSGASTITMQLARMVDPTPPTVSGKLQEIWLAWRMGAGMNRDQILHAYVNRLPMGGNLYGVEAAAQAYFGSSAKNLNLAQASLLAAIPNHPNQLNPYEHWANLKRRQRYVLEQMRRDGYLDAAQVERTAAEQVTLRPRSSDLLAAPHFLFWVSPQLPPDPPAQVITTLDRDLQAYVQAQAQAIVQTLAAHQVTQAAALVVDNASGEVLAYVGSTDYFQESTLGRNDGVQALRQPGSTLKPFLYQLALDRGLLRPNSILADVPTAYAIPEGRIYQPLDYHQQFLGPVRVRLALANSLNIPAVRLLERVTVPAFLDHLRSLQFEHLTQDPEFYGLGLALGSGEVSLWELARAYLTLAQQGTPQTLRVLPGASPTPPAQPPSPTWAFIADVLSDRYARAQSFGVDSVLSLPFPAAVKTGTSSDYRDTWTIGFTRDYTVATWVGNFDGSPMRNVSGVTGSAPLWHWIMLHLHSQRDPLAFDPPAGWVQRPICALTGKRPTSGCTPVVQEYLNEAALAGYQRGEAAFLETAAGVGRSPSGSEFPAQYDRWLAQHSALGAAQDLKIVSPQPGGVYLLSGPGSSPPPQLEFRVQGGDRLSSPLQWVLNGEPVGLQREPAFFWSLQPGDWTLQVSAGDKIDQVRFQVLEEPFQPDRRGFSLGDAP